MKKKYIIGALVFTLLVAVTLFQNIKDDAVTVINPAHKTSPVNVFAHAFEKAVGESNNTKTKFYQASSCEDAKVTYNKTKNAVLIYTSSIEFAARNKGLDCTVIGQKSNNVIFVGSTYMYICRLPNSTKQLGDEPATLGMASMFATPNHEKQYKDHGANIKIIPYGGSGDVLNALQAGDIDLGWMGSGLAKKQGNKIDCLYSTDPNDANYLGKTVPMVVPDFRIAYVVYTNATSKKVIQQLRSVASNEGFNKYLNSSLTKGVWNIEQSNVDAVWSFVDLMENTWSDKK